MKTMSETQTMATNKAVEIRDRFTTAKAYPQAASVQRLIANGSVRLSNSDADWDVSIALEDAGFHNTQARNGLSATYFLNIEAGE